tara:strand:+ start:1995 stop:2636 length:642 start_codon:yes stop_codon:yes gene_type:complete
MSHAAPSQTIKDRFRGYYPVVIDVETAGFNAETDALLEIAATLLDMNEEGDLVLLQTLHFHIEPFPDANIEQSAIEFNGIDPFDLKRGAIREEDALREIFKAVRKQLKRTGCHRAILVAHNATFDKSFVRAATTRCKLKRDPFHPFTTFDTATLSGLVLGQTVLAKACETAQIEFSQAKAHSAQYDTEKTAELFCWMVNRWKTLGGWPVELTD